jgi:hypothetical protein
LAVVLSAVKTSVLETTEERVVTFLGLLAVRCVAAGSRNATQTTTMVDLLIHPSYPTSAPLRLETAPRCEPAGDHRALSPVICHGCGTATMSNAVGNSRAKKRNA